MKPESFLVPTSDKVIWVTGGAGYLGTPVVATLDALGVKTLCLALPGTTEVVAWGHPTFRVDGKIFVGYGHKTVEKLGAILRRRQA